MKFKLFNIHFHISYYFASILALIISNDQFIISIFFLLTIIIHELGHLICIYVFKITPSDILFQAYGIQIKLDSIYSMSYSKELVILLGGSGLNFIVSAILFYLHKPQLLFFIISNISIGVFNLLPIHSLDGGRIIYIILTLFTPENIAHKISFCVSLIFILGFSILDFLLILCGTFNISLSLLCIMLILKIFD